MGSGKTTIGNLLAKELGCTFIDLDLYIENRYHKKIKDIFGETGEEKFREIEHRMLEEVSDFEDVVISPGGGAACFFENMQLMNQKGITIYLKTGPKILAKRLSKVQETRPLLKNKSEKELLLYIEEMLDERESFYNQSAMIVENDGVTPSSTINSIKERLADIKK